MSKLNLHSVAQLVVYAVRNEVIRVQVPARDHRNCQDPGQSGESPAEIFGA
jgi:hypothetical protein